MEDWKEAASLIIVANTPSSPDSQWTSTSSSPSSSSSESYRLLMTKRSAKSSFLASAFVFPGGHLEASDFSPRWWQVFRAAGFCQQDVNDVVQRIRGTRPPITTDCLTRAEVVASLSPSSSSPDDSVLPADIGLRICAIRETFEETGVLLVERLTHDTHDGSKVTLDTLETDKWREKVRGRSENFIDFCLEMKYAPNIWELREWWNWLTPNALGHRRFDTMFYLYCTHTQPEAISDQQEVAKIEVSYPEAPFQVQI